MLLGMLMLAGLFSFIIGFLVFLTGLKGQKTISTQEPMNDEEKRKLKWMGVFFAMVGLILLIVYGIYKIPFSFVLYVG